MIKEKVRKCLKNENPECLGKNNQKKNYRLTGEKRIRYVCVYRN